MASLGEDLKIEREKRGVLLEQIAQQTKVSVRHLRALEAERFDQLPGGVFNRGILRNYLQFLALDEAPWLERFAQTPGSSGPNAAESNDWLRYAHTVTGVRPSPPGANEVRFRWLGVALLFLLLAIGGWLTYMFAARHWRHSAATPVSSKTPLLYSDYVFRRQAAPPDSC